MAIFFAHNYRDDVRIVSFFSCLRHGAGFYFTMIFSQSSGSRLGLSAGSG